MSFPIQFQSSLTTYSNLEFDSFLSLATHPIFKNQLLFLTVCVCVFFLNLKFTFSMAYPTINHPCLEGGPWEETSPLAMTLQYLVFGWSKAAFLNSYIP